MKQLSNWSAEYSSDFKYLLFINKRGTLLNLERCIYIYIYITIYLMAKKTSHAVVSACFLNDGTLSMFQKPLKKDVIDRFYVEIEKILIHIYE